MKIAGENASQAKTVQSSAEHENIHLTPNVEGSSIYGRNLSKVLLPSRMQLNTNKAYPQSVNHKSLCHFFCLFSSSQHSPSTQEKTLVHPELFLPLSCPLESVLAPHLNLPCLVSFFVYSFCRSLFFIVIYLPLSVNLSLTNYILPFKIFSCDFKFRSSLFYFQNSTHYQ